MPVSKDKPGTVSSLTNTVVLVTRPVHLAANLVALINSRGGRAISLPTVDIEYTTDAVELKCTLDGKGAGGLAVFTSRNSVGAIDQWLRTQGIEWPCSIRCAAVGPKTAQAVRRAFKVQEVIAPAVRFGAAGLLEVPQMQDLKEVSVSVFDGGEGTGLLQEQLVDRCRNFRSFVVYRREMPDPDTSAVSAVMNEVGINYVVVTSVTGASNLFHILGATAMEVLQSSYFVAYSERIKNYLVKQEFDRVIVSAQASDEAVVSAIENDVARQ